LPQRQGARQRNKPAVKKHNENPTPKQAGWCATRADLQNLRTTYKFKLAHLTEGGVD
jgi:hypothetical protein